MPGGMISSNSLWHWPFGNITWENNDIHWSQMSLVQVQPPPQRTTCVASWQAALSPESSSRPGPLTSPAMTLIRSGQAEGQAQKVCCRMTVASAIMFPLKAIPSAIPRSPCLLPSEIDRMEKSCHLPTPKQKTPRDQAISALLMAASQYLAQRLVQSWQPRAGWINERPKAMLTENTITDGIVSSTQIPRSDNADSEFLSFPLTRNSCTASASPGRCLMDCCQLSPQDDQKSEDTV